MTERLGFGTTLEIGDGAAPSENFATIGQIATGPDVEESSDKQEVTSHSSPSRNGKPVKQYMGGPIDPGSLTFTVNYDYDNATHKRATGLKGMIGLVKTFRLREAGSTTRETFTALIERVGRQYPVGTQMQMSVTLQITSDIAEEAVV